MNNAFLSSEGIPYEIWFDNIRTVVDQSRTQFRKITWNQWFYEYSKDAGFKPIACRPYRPQTKGKVEALARMVEQLKVYNGEFDTLEDLIDLVFEFNEERNKEIFQAIDGPPILKFTAHEKEHLLPFDSKLLTTYTQDILSRKVSKESLIIYQKNKYSIPVRYIGNLEILIRLKWRYLNILKLTITQNAYTLPWAIKLLKTLKKIPLGRDILK